MASVRLYRQIFTNGEDGFSAEHSISFNLDTMNYVNYYEYNDAARSVSTVYITKGHENILEQGMSIGNTFVNNVRLDPTIGLNPE